MRLLDITGAKPSGKPDQFLGKCPGHEDKTASLSLRLAPGKILLNCFTGCPTSAILGALNWEPRHLFEDSDERNPPAGKTKDEKLHFRETARYTYTQSDGTPQFIVVRKEATDRDGKKHKKFSQSGFNPDGSPSWSMQGVKRLPFRLPQLLEAIKSKRPILFTEGEKDCLSAETLGFAATTLPGGAKKVGGEELAESCLHWLADGDIILCPDRDETGKSWMQMLGSKLDSIAKRVRWLELPNLPPKGDLSDWIAQGGDAENLRRLIDEAPEFEVPKLTDAEPPPPKLRALSIAELLTLELPERKNLMAPWLPAQGLVMVFAPRGIGKSWFCWQVALSVATGTPFLSWEVPEPKRVLLLDGEMPAAVLKERFAQLIEALPVDPPEDLALRIVTPDLQELGMPDISEPEGQAALEPFVADADLIIVDNLSSLCRNGRENESESWIPIQEWALRQRARGKSVLFVHHSGKSGDQRGSSKREDVLDTAISLRRPEGYSANEGARFEIHFTKARGFFGADAEPLDIRLEGDDAGRLRWTSKTLSQSTYERVLDALRNGFRQNEIASMLGLSKQAISRHAKRARETGDWSESTGRVA